MRPTTKMWEKLYTGNADSQSDIYSWMSSNAGSYTGGLPGENGINSDLFTAALVHFSGAAYAFWYDSGSTCNGGRSCQVQGIADIHSSLKEHAPVAVKVYGNIYGIVNEWGAGRKCNWLVGCQPSWDFYLVHVPASGAGSALYITASNFASIWYSGGTYLSEAWYVESWPHMSVSNSDFADADDVALTYYGDPDPPDPQYSEEEAGGGDGEAPPIFAPVKFLKSRLGDRGAKAARAARFSNVVAPNPSNRDEIIADFAAGVQRTHISNVKGLESLSLKDRRLSLQRRIDYVKSLDDRSDSICSPSPTVSASNRSRRPAFQSRGFCLQ